MKKATIYIFLFSLVFSPLVLKAQTSLELENTILRQQISVLVEEINVLKKQLESKSNKKEKKVSDKSCDTEYKTYRNKEIKIKDKLDKMILGIKSQPVSARVMDKRINDQKTKSEDKLSKLKLDFESKCGSSKIESSNTNGCVISKNKNVITGISC